MTPADRRRLNLKGVRRPAGCRFCGPPLPIAPYYRNINSFLKPPETAASASEPVLACRSTMTRYVLLLVGALLAVSAASLFGDRASHSPLPTATPLVRIDPSDPENLFLPNLGTAPVDAFFYMVRDRSVVLLKSRTIESTRADLNQTKENLYFIGANTAPKLSGTTGREGPPGFERVRYTDLYEGIDLTLSGGDTEALSATLTLSADADVRLIHFKLDENETETAFGLSAYQIVGSTRREVDVRPVEGLFGSTKLELGDIDTGAPVHVGFRIRL